MIDKTPELFFLDLVLINMRTSNCGPYHYKFKKPDRDGYTIITAGDYYVQTVNAINHQSHNAA